MKFCSCLFCALLLLTGLLPVTPAAAVTLGQTPTTLKTAPPRAGW